MIAVVKWWILFSAFCSACGWLLSALHALGGAGYLAAGLAAAAGGWAWQKCRREVRPPARRLAFAGHCHRLKRRFRRPLPGVFLLLALCALVGGSIYPPNNYDALTYRIPRVLHWLAEGQWHWIPTQVQRMNYSACGVEWLLTPIIALTRSERACFLLNLIPYSMLPSLVFLAFRCLGVRSRVAWHWMWILPGGYCYLLQAGSVGNDSFATVFLLAAIYLAGEAARSNRPGPLAWSVLAAGLLTGAKASNLPLLLPWAAGLWPARRFLFSREVIAAGLLALGVSFLPLAVLNHHFAGHWSGDRVDRERLRARDPVTGLLGNTLQLVSQNLAPPIIPSAKRLEQAATDLMPASWRRQLADGFPCFSFGLKELAQEESAGVGMGIALLACWGAMVGLARRCRGDRLGAGPNRRQGGVVALAAWVALLFFMTQMASEATARLVTPYYPFLLVGVLLLPGQERLVRRNPWRVSAVLAGLVAVVVVMLTPARPLWPAQTVWKSLLVRHPDSALVQRGAAAYAVYAQRADSLAPLRKWLPAEETAIGFLAGVDDPETPLWRPFGRRRVYSVLPGDDGRRMRQWGVNFVVVSAAALEHLHHQTLEQWLADCAGQVVGHAALTLKAAVGKQDWYVVRLPPERP